VTRVGLVLSLVVALGFQAIAGLPPLSVNVRDFGAKGDGVADDTEAIQRAFDQADSLSKIFPRPITASHPEVVIPEGVYKISKTLILAAGQNGAGMVNGSPVNSPRSRGLGHAYVRGEGKAVLKLDSAIIDLLYIGMGYRVVVEGLTFIGGRDSIRIWTNNQDVCQPVIRGCRFLDAVGYAIHMPYILQAPDKRFFGYLQRSEDGSMSEPRDPTAAYFLYNSTYLHIADCEFENCLKILYTSADMGLMENCRMVLSPAMKGAACVVAGLMKFRDVNGLATVTEGNEQRWIDLISGTQSRVYGERVSFDTTGDKGLCVVRCFGMFKVSTSTYADVIALRDSSFKVAGCPENAVIYLQDAPNLITISGCVQTGGKPVKAIAFAEEKPDDYFRKVLNPGKRALVPTALGFQVDDGNTNIDVELPVLMRPFARTPLSSKQNAPFEAILQPKVPAIKPGDFKPVRTLSVEASGVVGDGIADDTEALRKLLASVGNELVEVDFPGTIYRISGIIELPKRVILRGRGRAIFFSADGATAGFAAPDARELAFLNLSFESGIRQIDLEIAPGSRAKILFDNCTFSNAWESAVSCRTETRDDDSRLRLTDCIFYNNKRHLDANVDTTLESSWLETYVQRFQASRTHYRAPRTWEGRDWSPQGKGVLLASDPIRDHAFIRNDGRMRITGLLGVPLSKGLHRDLRWIDSTGDLALDYNRFGSESGGYPVVNVKGGAGFTGVRDSWTFHFGGSAYYPEDDPALIPPSKLVQCEALPAALVLEGNVGQEASYPPRVMLGETVQAGPKVQLDALKAATAFSNNSLPEDIGKADR